MSDKFPLNNNNLNQSNIIIENNNENKIIEQQDNNQELGIQPHTFTATDKNLVNAFAELLSGRKIPSEMVIIDPKTGKESAELKKELCQAAVKVATALMVSIPGKESFMGFQLGDFSVELRRDPLGKFFMSVEGIDTDDDDNHIIVENLNIEGGMGEKDIDDDVVENNINPQEKNVILDREVAINDTTSKFASLVAEDVLNNPELYEQDENNFAEAKAKRGSFTAIDQLLVANEQSPRASLNRNLLLDAMKAKLNLEPNEFNGIGIKTLSHWAAQSVLDSKMNVESIRTAINSYNKGHHILENVNSLEAAADLAMIEELLQKNPNTVSSKVDISNIGQVRTDPQQGMTENQKLIHNFIADLFMPADTALYDDNEGKSGNRIRQIMLQHTDAIKIMLEDSYNKGKLPLDTLPAGIKDALEPVLKNMFIAFTNDYLSLLDSDEAKADFGALVSQSNAVLTPELVKGVITKTSFEKLEELDKAVNEASQKAAESQQQLVSDKFTATLLNNNEENTKNRFVQPVQRNIRKIITDIVQTPKPTQEELQNNPQAAGIQQEQRHNELRQAFKAVMFAYKDVVLALEHMTEKDPFLAPDRHEYTAMSLLSDCFTTIMDDSGILHPTSFFSDEGSAFFDEIMNSQNIDETIDKYYTPDVLDAFMHSLTQDANGKAALTDDLERLLQANNLSHFNIDITSPTLSQMAAEPDEFNKPGMGKLIKNVLMSYFGTKPTQLQLPQGMTDELIALANTLAAAKEANPKLPGNLNNEQKNMVREAISAIREANSYNAKLPELLKTREVDKRAMISSMVRYSDDKASDSARLGAMLKGAGPLMHKLLQGLEIPGMDPDFKTALDDMKSNLNPIDPKYVQAQMLKIVENSNNTISNLKITKPLGAASVGQAFQVTVTPVQGEPYEAVLKVIRPEVSVKTKREFEQFMIEARRIPGMEDTYKGLYEQYQKEFSLKLEADNIRLGQEFYSDGIDTDRVETMSLVNGVPATETSMLIKQAPGDTLDRYIKKIKNRVDELKRTVAVNMDEYISNRIEMQKLYKEMHDINTSLGVTAKKWLNKCLFTESGFFHGDMHPGNLMVAPANPDDPLSKSKITIIDYGNASKLTPQQTKALLKVNVACSFGGVYQFDADAEQKPTVAKHTLNLFLEGFKSLLSKEERESFEKRETELVNNVIKPILLKGTKNEVGVRLSLLITKLQQAGISIPGAISNMAESEKRLSNGIDELNSLMNEVNGLLSNYVMDNVTTGADPAYEMIYESFKNGKIINDNKLNELIKTLNYDYKFNKNVVKELYDAKHPDMAILANLTNEDARIMLNHRNEAQKKYEKYRNTESLMTLILRKVDSGFKHSLEDMWENRQVKHINELELDAKMQEMTYGNYLKSPKESDPLYALHQQFLQARGKLTQETLTIIRTNEDLLENHRNDEQRFEQHYRARNEIAEIAKNPDVAEYMRIREEMAKIIKERILSAAQRAKNNIPKGNIANEPGMAEKQSLTTATIEVVSDKVSSDNQLIAIRNAYNFAEQLGFGKIDMTFNLDKKKTYFQIMADKFIKT